MKYQLTDFDHFRDDKRVVFKKEVVFNQNVIIVSYMIADDQFWKIPLAKECRGITFDARTGQLLALPFRKFFNIGEREETQQHKINWDGAEIFEKRDGSMVTPALINGQIYLKTKKSFFSDVALAAQILLLQKPNILGFCYKLCKENFTPIFEFTHPNFRIVLDYDEPPELTLLAIRDNYTGEELPWDLVVRTAKTFNVSCVNFFPEIKFPQKTLFQDAKKLTNVEGWVIKQRNGERVKLKTVWYLANHHIRFTQLREKEVALAVAEERIDDLKSELSFQGKSINGILKIENQVISELKEIVENTLDLFEKIRKMPTRKDAALQYSNNPVFGLAIKLLENKEPNYIEFWKKFKWKNNYDSLTLIQTPQENL